MKLKLSLFALCGALALSGCNCGGGGNDGGTGGGVGGGNVGGGGGSVGGGSGGGGGGGGGGQDAGLPLGQFCGLLATAVCNYESTCQFLGQAQQADCVAFAKARCGAATAQVTSGHRAYDAAAATKCLAELQNASCRDGRMIDPAYGDLNLSTTCTDALIKPGAALGHACTSSSDCKQGFCPDLNGACATCTDYTAVGQPCDFSAARCDPKAATCASDGDGGTVCTALLGAGQGPCTYASDCLPGLRCNSTTTNCEQKVVDGQPCTYDSDCANGWCNGLGHFDGGMDLCGTLPPGQPCYYTGDCDSTGYCDANKICQPRLALNDACDPAVAYGDSCSDGGVCRDGVCKVVNESQTAGQECQTYATPPDCTVDLYCGANPDGGTVDVCLTRLPVGSVCNYDSDCQAGLGCIYDSNASDYLCTPISQVGGGCPLDNKGCADLLWCHTQADGGGGCETWGMLGSDCTDPIYGGYDFNAVCVDPSWSYALCDSPDGGNEAQCLALGQSGAPCKYSYDCASSRCLQSDGGNLNEELTGTCADLCP